MVSITELFYLVKIYSKPMQFSQWNPRIVTVTVYTERMLGVNETALILSAVNKLEILKSVVFETHIELATSIMLAFAANTPAVVSMARSIFAKILDQIPVV